MALTDRSAASRAASVFPHLEGGYPATANGTINPRRFLDPDSSGNVGQATGGSTTAVGVYPEPLAKAAGDRVFVGWGPQPVDADDVLVPGREVKVGYQGKAITFLSTALTSTTMLTTGNGLAFGNQPANDGVEVLSSSAADTTQTVTIIGTTTGTDAVVVETVTLNGTSVVSTTKTDWGQVLAVKLSASCAGTVTVREASADATITTITTGNTSKGVETVLTADQQAYNVIPQIVCSGTGTKQIGLKGTDSSGATIYDSQALTGATAVAVNTAFKRVTEVYTGDLESNRTVTLKTGATAEDRQLARGRVLVGAAAAGDTAYVFVRP